MAAGKSYMNKKTDQDKGLWSYCMGEFRMQHYIRLTRETLLNRLQVSKDHNKQCSGQGTEIWNWGREEMKIQEQLKTRF